MHRDKWGEHEGTVKQKLKDALIAAIRTAETTIPTDVRTALARALAREVTPRARSTLATILEDIKIAHRDSLPMCQDTGMPTFFVTAGVASPYLAIVNEAISQAVADATLSVPLRPNTVDPFTGKNPGNNLGRGMPVINWDVVPGGEISIDILPKGGGSENMSALKMLVPSAGIAGIKETVVEHVIACGGLPCPPTIIGVGIGGGAACAMRLATRALLRNVGDHHPNPEVAKLEQELLALINQTGVGPMGLGGKTTALAVHVEYAMRHPASLPVGIVLQCWADRRAQVRIRPDGHVEVS